MVWKWLFRPPLFCLPAETAHYWSMNCFAAACRFGPLARFLEQRWSVSDPRLETSLWGLHFPNPVGLAAGFDKDARWFRELFHLGFGSVEVGTLTGQPQPGNPRPRLFRLKSDRALINRMGFNNGGAEAAANRLARDSSRKFQGPAVLGVNIGKTKVVEIDRADQDYVASFRCLFPFADYFVVNVSSPNTPGLRTLQEPERLNRLLETLGALNRSLAAESERAARPLLLKIAPDLSPEQLEEVAGIAVDQRIDGMIATNTTVERQPLTASRKQIERIGAGGLSGQPLTERSRQVVRVLFRATQGQMPIVGVGGIMCGEDAWKMITAGASLVQVYTGFVYGGPGFVASVNRYLSDQLDRTGLADIAAAVGADA